MRIEQHRVLLTETGLDGREYTGERQLTVRGPRKDRPPTQVQVMKRLWKTHGQIDDFIAEIHDAAEGLIDPKMDIEYDAWGDDSNHIAVSGWRPITDQEKKAIQEARKAESEQQDSWERQQYERLREKFEK